MNSLYIWRIYFECTIFFLNSLRLYNLFREFTIYFANFSWIHSLCRGFSKNSLWIYFRFREFTMNSLSVSRIFYEFSIFFANSLSFSEIHYLFRVNTKIQSLILWKSLSFLTFIRCFHFDSRELYRVVSFWPRSKFIRFGTLWSFEPEKYLICPSWTSCSPYIWFSLSFDVQIYLTGWLYRSKPTGSIENSFDRGIWY